MLSSEILIVFFSKKVLLLVKIGLLVTDKNALKINSKYPLLLIDLKKNRVFQHQKKGILHDILLNDEKDYKRVEAAMKQMGIPSDEMMEIFQVVAGVLHIGNIVFEDAGGSSGKSAIAFQIAWCLLCRSKIFIFVFSTLRKNCFISANCRLSFYSHICSWIRDYIEYLQKRH